MVCRDLCCFSLASDMVHGLQCLSVISPLLCARLKNPNNYLINCCHVYGGIHVSPKGCVLLTFEPEMLHEIQHWYSIGTFSFSVVTSVISVVEKICNSVV